MVDHVQVTVAEELGVELRGGYYENCRRFRDMVPNDIFQVITLGGDVKNPPISFDADAVHDEQKSCARFKHLIRDKVPTSTPPLTDATSTPSPC